jgi:hypothetical protein
MRNTNGSSPRSQGHISASNPYYHDLSQLSPHKIRWLTPRFSPAFGWQEAAKLKSKDQTPATVGDIHPGHHVYRVGPLPRWAGIIPVDVPG